MLYDTVNMNELKVHDHACLIYENDEEWAKAVIPFIDIGLEKGEKCVYVCNIRTANEVRYAFNKEGVNIEYYEETGQFFFVDRSILPVMDSGNKIEQLKEFFIKFTKECVDEGYPVVRATIEALYTMLGFDDASKNIELNLNLNRYFFPYYPVLALCQYDRWKVEPRLLRYVILSHPIILKNNLIYRDLFQEVLVNDPNKKDGDCEAELWLSKVERERREFFFYSFENSTQPMVVVYRDGTVVAFNKALCDLTGFNRSELNGLLSKEEPYHSCIRDMIKEEGPVSNLEKDFLMLNGSKRLLNISIFRSYNGLDKVQYHYIFIKDISRRRWAEEELKKSEERYRTIVDHAYDGIILMRVDNYKVIYINSRGLEYIQYSEEDVVGKDCTEFLYPDDKEENIQDLIRGIKIGEGSGEFRCLKKDGDFCWLEYTGRIINKHQEVPEVLLICRNISERKAAEEALKESEAQLRRINQNMLDYIVCLNRKGIFEYLSPSIKNVMGYEPEKLVGRHNLELVHPEDRKKTVCFVTGIINNASSGRIEYKAKHVNGDYIWLESVVNSLLDDNGEVKEMIVASRDISSRKNTEDKLYESEHNLKKQLDYMSTLIDNMNEYCYTYDRDSKLMFANKKVAESTGYSLEEVRGRCILDFIAEEDKQKVMEMADEHLTKGGSGNDEYRILCKDGNKILVNAKTSPIVEDGVITGRLVLAEDITEHRKIEKEMARLDRLHTIGKMAASMGHEIRNPMTTVSGFLQMLSCKDEFLNYRSYFDIMLEELERANSIIAEFLSLAKNKIMNLQHNNLNNIIESIYPLLRADATLGDKSIITELEPVPDLLLDEKEIRQLIYNLVRNGLEAMNYGGRVCIKTYKDKDEVVLAVSDQGQGIKAEEMDKIGTPFYSTKENGTGMGMAVCYSIASRHMAEIKIDSNSSGSTFLVRFKQVKSEPELQESYDGFALKI